MKGSFLRTVVTLFVGWLLYSMTGTIPIYMAFPLPDFMHTNKTSLPDGYTDENKLSYDLDREIVNAGTFESLGLFDNGNAFQNSYYDPQKHAYHIYYNGCTYRLPTDAPSDDEVLSEHPYDVALHIGNYEYLPQVPIIATRRGTLQPLTSWRGSYLNEGKVIHLRDDTLVIGGQNSKALDLGEVTQLLTAQQTEKITIRDLAVLLHLRYSGRLLGWFAQEQMATFDLGSGEYTVIAIDGEKVHYNHFENTMLSHTHAVAPYVLIGYDEGRKAIVQHDFSMNENDVLIGDVPAVVALNVSMVHDAPVLGGFFDPDTAFVYNCATDELTYFNLDNGFTGEKFLFCDNEFLLVMTEKDGFRWIRGSYI